MDDNGKCQPRECDQERDLARCADLAVGNDQQSAQTAEPRRTSGLGQRLG